MEIASPTPLSNPFSLNRSKRSYACAQFAEVPVTSSIMSESISDDTLIESPAFGTSLFKRRRFTSTEEMGDAVASPFQNASPFPPLGNTPNKRCRTEVSPSYNLSQAQQQIVSELRRLVDHQAAELERLKSTNQSNEDIISKSKPENEKILNENRILKRAVAIQQERQQHASNELQAACRYKTEADERIRMLEQMNLTLRYRLEAQSPSYGNDFMRFSPQPPDVF